VSRALPAGKPIVQYRVCGAVVVVAFSVALDVLRDLARDWVQTVLSLQCAVLSASQSVMKALSRAALQSFEAAELVKARFGAPTFGRASFAVSAACSRLPPELAPARLCCAGCTCWTRGPV
jgi:hypothetical protein